MKKFLFLSCVFALCVPYSLESLQRDTQTLYEINAEEKVFDDAAFRYGRNKIQAEAFLAYADEAINRLNAISTSQDNIRQFDRDLAFTLLIKVTMKLKDFHLLTEQMINDFLTTVQHTIIPRNLMGESKDNLALFLNDLTAYFIAQNKLEQALRCITILKKSTTQEKPVSQRHIGKAYSYQTTIAEMLANAPLEERDLTRARKLLIEVIVKLPEGERIIKNRALEILFTVIYEQLQQDIALEELDALLDILNNITDGTYPTNLSNKNKAYSYKTELSLHYSSPAINRPDKAREILQEVENSDSTPKIRKTARDALKKLNEQ